MSLTVTLEINENCFANLEVEWLTLLQRSVTSTIFQTPQFLKTWWETLGTGTLQVLIVRDESNTLRGIAPLFSQQNSVGRKELNFIGCVNVSDYLDIIVDKDHATAVYEALFVALNTQLEWQELFWCSIPEDSPTREFFKSHFPNAVEQVQDVTPQITLPGSWEEYLSLVGRKQRHEIKRKWRRLEELDHQFKLVTDPTEASAATQTFIALHKASSAEKREFWNEAHLVFFRKLLPAVASAGWLHLYFLKIEQKPVASMLLFLFNNRYSLYNSGFLPDAYKEIGTGTTLTAYTIQQAIAQGLDVYDFLRGGEGYKLRLGAETKNVYDVRVIKN